MAASVGVAITLLFLTDMRWHWKLLALLLTGGALAGQFLATPIPFAATIVAQVVVIAWGLMYWQVKRKGLSF